MPRFVLSYDLKKTDPDPYDAFLEAASDNGWDVWFPGTDKEYKLPNTTLWGDFDDMDDADRALDKTRTDTEREIGVKVTITKWIIVERVRCRFNSNETR